MSISVVQVATSETDTATFAANVTAGNTVFVIPLGYATSGLVISTSNVELGGVEVDNTTLLQGYQSENSPTPCAGHSVWMLPNCPAGSKAVTWVFTSAPADSVSVAGTIAYEVAGLGTNPLPTMRTAASSSSSTAIDTGSTGNLQFANEFVLATAVTHAGASSGPIGWTSVNNGTNNCWAGYQIVTSPGSSYDWAQTGSAADYWSAGVVSVLANSGDGAPYRIFNGIDGPATPQNYTGSFIAGVTFETTQGNCWFEGYWWWVCASGQSTTATKCALWQFNGQGSGSPSLVPGSVITSGTLIAGQWNYIPLSTPVQLSIGTAYIAAVGVNGGPFPDTNNTWGSGQIYPSGVTIGPLNCYGKAGTNTVDYALPQGVFTTLGTDPSVDCPENGSNTDNFWVDVQITDQTPVGYTGSYRLWPNSAGDQFLTSADSAVNYVVGTEIDLSQPCTLNKIWYFSPGGTAQLATECGVWSIATQLLVAQDASPTWSGVAGSGWVACTFNGVTLPVGKYRVAVYGGAGVPDQWSAKSLYYWIWSGAGANGITSGPLYAPDTGHAQNANIYQGSGSEPGQAVFAVGPPNAYPNLYVDNLYQNYWVDMEVTPVISTVNGAAFMAFFP